MSSREELRKAEAYIANSRSNGVRNHYNVRGVQDILKGRVGSQGKVAYISNEECKEILYKIRGTEPRN